MQQQLLLKAHCDIQRPACIASTSACIPCRRRRTLCAVMQGRLLSLWHHRKMCEAMLLSKLTRTLVYTVPLVCAIVGSHLTNASHLCLRHHSSSQAHCHSALTTDTQHGLLNTGKPLPQDSSTSSFRRLVRKLQQQVCTARNGPEEDQGGAGSKQEQPGHSQGWRLTVVGSLRMRVLCSQTMLISSKCEKET